MFAATSTELPPGAEAALKAPASGMLRNLEPCDYAMLPTRYTRAACRHLEDRKRQQRASLIVLLERAAPGEAAFSGCPDQRIVDAALSGWVSTAGTASDAARLMGVCKAWRAAVRLWLRTDAATAFWQRFLTTLLPAGVVRHPELASAAMVLEWAKLPMAVGSRDAWVRCGRGRAEGDEDAQARTELELALELAELFVVWCNTALEDDCPRWMGWYRLYFNPYLKGCKHETDGIAEEEREVWELQGGVRIPHSLSANIVDCIGDFRCCPNCSEIPEVLDDLCCRVRNGADEFIGLPDPRTAPLGQWRFVPVSDAQNEKMFALLRRYAPLFPQEDDLLGREPVQAVWKGRPWKGRERRTVLRAPLLDSAFNSYMCLDRYNTKHNPEDSWDWCEPRVDPALLSQAGLDPSLVEQVMALSQTDDEESDDGDSSATSSDGYFTEEEAEEAAALQNQQDQAAQEAGAMDDD